MTNKEADLGLKFLDGALGQAESGEIQCEKGAPGGSSSSSDGSNVPQPNLTPSATSTLQRSLVTFEIGTANLVPATAGITLSQRQAAANLLPCSNSATEAETEASTVKTAATVVTGGLLQLSDNSNQNETQNQLLLFPHQSLRPASAGNTNFHLWTSNFPSDFLLEASTTINPDSSICTSSVNGSPFLSRQASLHHVITMQPQQQGPAAIFNSGYQNLLDQGLGATNIHHPIGTFQLQNMTIQRRMGMSLPRQLESLHLPTNSNTRMQMSWADNNPSALPITNLPPLNLPSHGQCIQTQFCNPYNTRYIRNSLYDPIFETWGLPVDPHLRMFIARRDNNGDE